MQTSLTREELAGYVTRQVEWFFPDKYDVRLPRDLKLVDLALDKVAYCFKEISLPHYCSDGKPRLNHLFADQYCQFLWFLSNVVWSETQDRPLADKLFGLNRALNGFNCMYDTTLPDIFILIHATGTVLGRASYSNFLVVFQNCTVGAHYEEYPVLGKGVALASGASIIGRCKIGDGVSIGSGTPIFKKDIPSWTNAYKNSHGDTLLRTKTPPYAQQFFNASLGPC